MTSRVTADCRARLERLFDYIGGELSPGRVRQLAKHLAECVCGAELQRDFGRPPEHHDRPGP